MKKAKYLVLLLLVPLLLLGGCGKKQTKYYDSEFITALEKGLQSRWDITDSFKNPDDMTKADYTKAVNAELDSVKDYKNKKFKNNQLHENALAYLNALQQQKSAIKDFSTSNFATKWSRSYDKRTEILLKINKQHKLKFSSKYESNWTELTRNGSDVANKNKKDQQIAELIKTIKFKQTKNDYGYKTYAANVKNTTDFSFKSFGLKVKLLNSKKTVVDTQSIYVDDWNKGQINRLEFSTDKNFSNYEIVKDYIG